MRNSVKYKRNDLSVVEFIFDLLEVFELKIEYLWIFTNIKTISFNGNVTISNEVLYDEVKDRIGLNIFTVNVKAADCGNKIL